MARLPPPVDDTQDGLRARNHTAIAKVAALLPVNATEADLAAQCIAARAQAEDVLLLLRQHTGDIRLVVQLNAQCSSMVRTSLSVHARLMRVQALRQKRDAIEASANEDAWARHIAERSMLSAVEPDIRPQQPTSPPAAPENTPPENTPETARVQTPPADGDSSAKENGSLDRTNSHAVAVETSLSKELLRRMLARSATSGPHAAMQEADPEPTPAATPAVRVDQRIAENVSEIDTNSHDAALEMWMSTRPRNPRSEGSDKSDLSMLMRAARAESSLADQS